MTRWCLCTRDWLIAYPMDGFGTVLNPCSSWRMVPQLYYENCASSWIILYYFQRINQPCRWTLMIMVAFCSCTSACTFKNKTHPCVDLRNSQCAIYLIDLFSTHFTVAISVAEFPHQPTSLKAIWFRLKEMFCSILLSRWSEVVNGYEDAVRKRRLKISMDQPVARLVEHRVWT